MNAPKGPIAGAIRYFLDNPMIVGIAVAVFLAAGIVFAPFAWNIDWFPRDPVPVDAIPDLGENQQIVFTKWPGRSPQDVEDQITYPLTVALLGLPDVKTVRSYSMFGFSSIYVIFKEKADFYDSRSRILEKLGSLPPGTLPEGVQPALGPDATALGQIFWYTLEGRDPDGNPTGGWDLDELRSVQDWYVRYGLMSAEGVSEVASVGGFVREYQIDVDPDALRAHGLRLQDVLMAVRQSNIDVGARTIEVNRVEYVVRGLGFVKSVTDLEQVVVAAPDRQPVTLGEIATVTTGPALRRGALDKEGAEAVGGVVVVRYGENPLQVIENVKAKIRELTPGLPSKTLPDGTVSKLTIVPFYDRSGLIHETLATLDDALTGEILVTIIVVIVMLFHLRSSLLVSGLLPLAVLMCFIGMKLFHVDANIVALSGIAIAIGTMVDMGVVLVENILRHLDAAPPDEPRRDVIHRAAGEVGSAVTTAVATTIVSFLPVFTMQAAEGKLFKPLAWTKTFALLASIVVALMVIPPAAELLLTRRGDGRRGRLGLYRPWLLIGVGAAAAWYLSPLIGAALALAGAGMLLLPRLHGRGLPSEATWSNILVLGVVSVLLAQHWLPLGAGRSLLANLLFVVVVLGLLLWFFSFFQRIYGRLLGWCLAHKALFAAVPLGLLTAGWFVWQGLGKEFMPPLDEGSYLYMPTTMPHASIGEATDVLAKLDMAISQIPEVESVVGKLGRADTPLDPAPISMIETIINYVPEYRVDENGRRLRFRYDKRKGEFVRDEQGELIPDPHGKPFRQWRDHIHSPDDIWDEIVKATRLPGVTSAPRLQPISARLVMLQSGMRAPMGIKVKGPDLETIDRVGQQLEALLKQVPSVEPSAVIADRVVGKPYLEIAIDREAIARYRLSIRTVQDVIEAAIGGRPLTMTVEGRERYPVRVRYARERRDSIEGLAQTIVTAPDGTAVPLGELAEIRYVRGPQAIKSEDTFLVSYVLFDKKPGKAEVDVVEEASAFLQQKIDSGELVLPAGVSYTFAGSYENQVRSQKRLQVVLPLALLVIFLILYFQFGSAATTAMVFSGIFVAWAGGFLLIWLYGQPWFLDVAPLGIDLRGLFQVHPVNLSVAVWVGFIALFGIASDNGVIVATYLDQVFAERKPRTRAEVRDAVLLAGQRRIRPAMMTTATTILALLPVMTSTGRGSDIMVPMAIPSFGGMLVSILSVLIVPVLYSLRAERSVRERKST